WTIDTTKSSTLKFKGYEGRRIPSEITGKERLKYDRNQPFTRDVAYQDYFKPLVEVSVPKAYIIPQGWWNIIALLKLNHVKMQEMENDTTISVENYRIISYESRKQPFEGHYQHYNTKIESSEKMMTFSKGDYYIETNQKAFRYLMETLEPQAPDSFFNWGFFDSILQQKEGFSPYVWEDIAKELLNNNEKLRMQFERKKKTEPEFAENWYAQLNWLHKQSPNYEMAHMQYPIYRAQ